MTARPTRAKRIKTKQDDFVAEFGETSEMSDNDLEDQEEARKSKIRDSNREFARRMTILTTWSEHWNDFRTREGEAYPQVEARDIIKRNKKISCPIDSCGKAFTSIGGLKYHYARCNIERSFKCKVCNPPTQLSTRGELLKHMILTHYNDLPALNDDQKEIAHSYLSCRARNDNSRRDRRAITESEASYNGQTLVKSFKTLRESIYQASDFQERPYKNWLCYTEDWSLILSETVRAQFYPPEARSPHVKHCEAEKWFNIKVGESHILARDKRGCSKSIVFFTGGLTTACAWQPKSIIEQSSITDTELLAVAVNCTNMDENRTYLESQSGRTCIQFWTMHGLNELSSEPRCQLEYVVAQECGTILHMSWCPLGASWQQPVNTANVLARVGLLAVACGDGNIRILSIPHTSTILSHAKRFRPIGDRMIQKTPIFKVKPVATLIAPNIGPTMSSSSVSPCRTFSWSLQCNQQFLVAGYANGSTAIFDLSNVSPILHSNNSETTRNIYHPTQSWIAHGGPITGATIQGSSPDRSLIATGGFDRQLKIWNPMDLNSCISTDRAPITRIVWDYRFRGILTATDNAFTSFSNRVSYRYPSPDGNHNVTISTHRSTVWGLDSSLVTSAIAVSDAAGEVLVMPQLIRSSQKRDKTLLSTHSIYTLVPQPLNKGEALQTIDSNLPDVGLFTNNELLVRLDNGIEDMNIPDSGYIEVSEADFSNVERPVANKPTQFLLPVEHKPVETYADFRDNFGLQYVDYDSTPVIQPDKRISDSCNRAGDLKQLYCDRPCDYPFSSINHVLWSPNPGSFSSLLSVGHIGLCRLDRIQIVDQIYRGYVESILNVGDPNSATSYE